MKKPWLAAALNLGLPGLGYVYVGHRLVLGVGLIILAVFAITSFGTDWKDVPDWYLIESVFLAILVAYDGGQHTRPVKNIAPAN